MIINLEHAGGKNQLALIRIQGSLDASNFQELVDAAKWAIDGGAQYLLLDMSKMNYISNSGLIALHSIILLARGYQPLNLSRWNAYRSITQNCGDQCKGNVKLLNPSPNVAYWLEITGMKDLFEIHAVQDTAIASFK